MKASYLLLILLGLVGCIAPDATDPGEGASRQVGTSLDASGDRLAPLVFYGDDGSVVTLGWVDRESGTRCDFRAVGGQIYCLPQDGVAKTDHYSDAACTTAITTATPAAKAPVIDVRSTGVYHAGALYKGSSYAYSLAHGCQSAEICEGQCQALDLIADGEYVTGSFAY